MRWTVVFLQVVGDRIYNINLGAIFYMPRIRIGFATRKSAFYRISMTSSFVMRCNAPSCPTVHPNALENEAIHIVRSPSKMLDCSRPSWTVQTNSLN